MSNPNTVNTFTDRRRAQIAGAVSGTCAGTAGAAPGPATLGGSVPEWLAAESITGPALSPSGRQLAFISDRDGLPALWVVSLHGGLEHSGEPVRLDTGTDQVRAVSWSPDGRWLACLLAPFGGERTTVLVVRPDGTGARTLAGGDGSAATLGGWRPDGRLLGVTESGGPAIRGRDARGNTCRVFLVDPSTGRRTAVAEGPAAVLSAVSPDGDHAVVRVGRRGARQLLLVELRSGRRTPLLTAAHAAAGIAAAELRGGAGTDTAIPTEARADTDLAATADAYRGAETAGEPADTEGDATVADARFSADGRTLYLHTDSGLARPALLTLELDAAGSAGPRLLAARPDADLELFALSGDRLATVWNVAGYSELELRAGVDGSAQPRRTAAEVITSCAFSPDGSWLLLGVQSPADPPHLVACPVEDGRPTRLVTPAPSWPGEELLRPTPLRFCSADGLELSGWWYPARGAFGPAPTVLWLHGGPEAQERPTFSPLLQALASAGVAVFAPNVRGSSGYGREFVNADNGQRRFAAIADVAAAARFLVGSELAVPDRLGVAGRSYGGYLTLAALVQFPELFRVGVDVCGMADLETFFNHTEPWIASAATSKYGDPRTDRALLRELSPLHRIDRLVAPLLVVHGEHDTNVPLIEAEQVLRALRDRGAAASALMFPDEGHEVHATANKVRFVHEVVDWLTAHLTEIGEQTA